MIHHIKGDLFANTSVDAYAHGVNCHGVMGKGIAVQFKQHYPHLLKAYQKYCRGFSDYELVGGVYLHKELPKPPVFNLFSQLDYRRSKERATIGAVYCSLCRTKLMIQEINRINIAHHLHIKSIAMPRIGCGLGELKWEEVKPIIERVFDGSGIEVYVHYLED